MCLASWLERSSAHTSQVKNAVCARQQALYVAVQRAQSLRSSGGVHAQQGRKLLQAALVCFLNQALPDCGCAQLPVIGSVLCT